MVNSERCIFIAPYSPKVRIGLVTINVLISITNNNLTIETKPKKNDNKITIHTIMIIIK